MAEHTTFSCDNCGTTVVAKRLPDNWDWVTIEAMQGKYRHSMHLCAACVGAMQQTRGRVLIERIIALKDALQRRRYRKCAGLLEAADAKA